MKGSPLETLHSLQPQIEVFPLIIREEVEVFYLKIVLLITFFLNLLISLKATEIEMAHPLYEAIINNRQQELLKFGALAISDGTLLLKHNKEQPKLPMINEKLETLNLPILENKEETFIGVSEDEKGNPQIILIHFPSITSINLSSSCQGTLISTCQQEFSASAGAAFSANSDIFPAITKMSQISTALKGDYALILGSKENLFKDKLLEKWTRASKVDAKLKIGHLQTSQVEGKNTYNVTYPTEVSLRLYFYTFHGLTPQLTYIKSTANLIQTEKAINEGSDQITFEVAKRERGTASTLKLFNDLKRKNIGLYYLRSF